MNNLLQTERIILRAVEPGDLEIIYKWENDTNVWRVSGTQKPYSKIDIKEYIKNSAYDIYTIKQLRLMIVNRSSLQTIGAIDLFDFDPNNRRVEIGVLIDNNFRRQGFASEALSLVCRYAFDMLDVHQLYANVDSQNEASRRLFENHGFELCGCRKQWIRISSGWLDEFTFQLIRK